MKIHHLDCGTMKPPIAPTMVCHVLLVETADHLTLVDTGFGATDRRDPKRLGPLRHGMGLQGDETAAAFHQIKQFGYEPEDVTDIVLTHLDFDHVSGIVDFPDARVHVTADEHDAALISPDFLDRRRYRTIQMAHRPHWRTYEGRGDLWREDLTAHRLEGLDGLALIPMPGHSRGHASVAVEHPDGSILIHAGDAVFDASHYTDTAPDGSPLKKVGALRTFEKAVGRDRKAIARNHQTLAALHAQDDVTVINAHDKRIFDALATPVE